MRFLAWLLYRATGWRMPQPLTDEEWADIQAYIGEHYSGRTVTVQGRGRTAEYRPPYWPDASWAARTERLAMARQRSCEAGFHDDPGHSGACIICGIDLDALREDA